MVCLCDRVQKPILIKIKFWHWKDRSQKLESLSEHVNHFYLLKHYSFNDLSLQCHKSEAEKRIESLNASIRLLHHRSQTWQGFCFGPRWHRTLEVKLRLSSSRKVPPAISFIYLRTIFVFKMSRYETRH